MPLEETLPKTLAMRTCFQQTIVLKKKKKTHLQSYLASERVCAKSLQSCPTLFDSKDRSLPDSSVRRILQARILEWVAISFSRASSKTVSLRSAAGSLPLAPPDYQSDKIIFMNLNQTSANIEEISVKNTLSWIFPGGMGYREELNCLYITFNFHSTWPSQTPKLSVNVGCHCWVWR